MQQADQHAVAEFEYSHRRINELVFHCRELTRTSPAGALRGARGLPSVSLRELLVALREELLTHLAREEEGLFPFVREHVPDMRDAVDRLAVAHDEICGSVVRLVHLATAPESAKGSALPEALATFERNYALHEREEREVLRSLARRLDLRAQAELSELVRGL